MSELSKKAVRQKDKILYIEPNDLPAFMRAKSANGDNLDNITWDPDDLNISVDLQVIIPSRQYNAKDFGEEDNFSLNGAKYHSILSGEKIGGKGKEGYLTTDWTNVSYQEIKNNRAGSKETFGINSIQITFDSYMYPRVTMNFTDVRGSSLMGAQEQRFLDVNTPNLDEDKITKNFFGSVFKFPYPRFLLSVKGIYGTCVTFVLSVEDFKATFNSDTGNFDVIIKFIGNMYGLYTDIPMNYLLIAPYIGSKSGGFTKNDYWEKQTQNGGAFFYSEDGVSGQPIKTFLEFYSEYHCAMGETGDALASAYGENLVDMAEAEREMAFLTGDEGIIPKYFDSIPGAVKESGEFVNGEDHGLKYNFVFFDSDIATVTLSPDFIDNGNGSGFAPAVEAYKKSFATGYDEVFQPDCLGVSGMWKEGKNAFQTIPINESLDTIFTTGRLGDLPGFTKAEADKIRPFISGMKRAYVYSLDVKKRAQERVEKIENEKSKKLEGARKEVEGFFKDMFGFSPTIENMMRMIFAHLDAFIHEFYATIKKIPGTRTLASLKFPKNLTDIESSSEGGAHVPPFTGFYKNTGDGKVERMYPGEDSRLKGIAEVDFVESIVNGISSMVKWQDDYIQSQENTDDDVEMGDDSSIEEMKFTATTLSDIFYEGENPYSTLANSNLYPQDVIYFFLSRCYTHEMLCQGDKDSEFATIEANNFIASDAFKIFKRKEGFKGVIEEFKKNGNIALTNMTVTSTPYISIPSYQKMKGKNGNIYLKFNGMNPGDNAYELKNHSGSEVTKYSESDIEKFANSYGTEKLRSRVDLTFNQKYHKLHFEPEVIPIIPLTYINGSYYPFFVVASDKKSAKTKVKYSSFKEFNKDTKKRGDDGNPAEFDYADYNEFLTNGDEQSFWIPIVPYCVRLDKYNVSHNLLIGDYGTNKGVNEALVNKDKGTCAFIFLSSLLWSYDRKLGDTKTAAGIKFFYKSNTWKDKAFKMHKMDYLLLCSLAFISKNKDTLNLMSYPTSSVTELEATFSKNEIDRLEAYFNSWLNSEYDTIMKFIKETKRHSTSVALADGTKIPYTSDVEEYGGVVAPNTPFQNLLKKLVTDSVILFNFSEVPADKMEAEIESSVLKKFAEIILDKLNSTEEDTETGETTNIEVHANIEFNEDSKNAIYYTLKNLYDRWLSMETEESFRLYSPEEEAACKKRKLLGETRIAQDRSEFINFVYVDSFYNDISRKFLANPGRFFNLIGDQFDGEKSYNILEFIGRICQDNKLLFKCLPVYSNVYNADTFSEIFTPHSLYDGASRTGRIIGNTYILMYTYEPSHLLDLEQDKTNGVGYGNDSFDIADSMGQITQESLEVMKKKNEDNGGNNYSICAFGVTAGKQNQSYFSKINVGMDNPRVTDYAIANKFQLANMSKRGGTINVVGAGQDLYSVYSNRSYDCSVEMLGCINIMPMMYFQLNNVPMFKGVYMITKVEHSIQNNTMTTKFTGTRQPKRYIPLTQNVFSIESINGAVNRLAGQDMNKEYNIGNVNFTVSDYDGTTTFRNYEGDNAKYNGKTNFPYGKTFYPLAAISQMNEILYYTANGGGYVIPFGNYYNSSGEFKGGSRHACASAVQSFLFAGFYGHSPAKTKAAAEANRVTSANKGFSGCNGYEMYSCLAKYGFKPIADHTNIDNVEFRAGDVCVMKHKTYGHVCMYTGKENGGRWVSDFDQNRWWVYGGDGPDSSQFSVLVYRFGGEISKEMKEYQK